MKRIMHLCLAMCLATMGALALPACTTAQPPGVETATPIMPTVELESTRALALANETYLAANAIAQKAIKAGLIKGEALQTVGRLDRQINALLDKASTARDAVQKASAIRSATDLILEFRNLVAPFKGLTYGHRSNAAGTADRRGHGNLQSHPGARQERPRYSG